MKIHHLNCISTCPLGGKLMDGGPESIVERGHLTNHCLLIETNNELVLVDTGLGLKDVSHPHSRLSEFFLGLVAPDFREEMTAIKQIQKMGYNPKDVRHIILTHLDFDHAGGLDDFSFAKVHMLHEEKVNAMAQKTWLDRQRFRPQQWSSKSRWQTYSPSDGDTWYGLNRVQQIAGVSDDIVMIPLKGHTFGHCGIAVRGEEKWMFQTGDAYFYHGEMNCQNPHCTPGLKFYQNMMDKDHKARVWNQERLRELKRFHNDEVEIFCSHDVQEFERLSGHSANYPSDKVRSVRGQSTIDNFFIK